MGNSSTVHALVSLVRKFSITVLFLCETKSNSSEVRRLKDRLGFDRHVCVEPIGRAGDLAFFLTEEVHARILTMDLHHIDCEVSNEGGQRWRMTGIYGWSESMNKCRTWNLITQLAQHNDLPWVVG